jgi:transcriptional regulator with XRE-family HTH domain
MPPSQKPPNVRQRRVARRLRQWRKTTDMTLEDVRQQLVWSEAKLSRFERAEVNAGPAEIIALATIYGIEESVRDATVRLAVEATKSNDQWGQYSPDCLRGNLKDYIEDEAEATGIHSVETVLVSGLLQTSAYSEALSQGWAPAGDHLEEERRILRQQRQARLDDPVNPLHLHAIFYESALHLPIGSSAVMREQLDHLLARAKQSNINIQVMPSSAGAFPGIGTSYHVVSFDAGESGAVYLENLTGGLYIEEEVDLERYMLNFERLRGIALSRKASARRISEIRECWT